MKEYHVTWEIDLNATSPLDAARKALEIQRDVNSIANVFQVSNGIDVIQIDLEENKSNERKD